MNPIEQLAANIGTAYVPKYAQGSTGYVFTEEQLRRFREHVIEEEHKRLLEGGGEPVFTKEHIAKPYPVEWVTVNYYTADQMAAAVLRERRRCAEIDELLGLGK